MTSLCAIPPCRDHSPAPDSITSPLVARQALAAGAFSVSGALALSEQRVTLRNVRMRTDDAEAQADADIELPLSAMRGRFDIAARGRQLSRVLPAARGLAHGDEAFELKLRGEGEGRSWRFDEAQFSAGIGRISGRGQLDQAPDFSATAFTVDASGSDLSAFGRLVDLKLPREPFELTAELTGTPTAFRVEQARGKLGPASFSGRMQLDLRARPVLDLELRTDLLDISALRAPSAAGGPAATAAATPPARARLISDTPIPSHGSIASMVHSRFMRTGRFSATSPSTICNSPPIWRTAG